MVRKLLAGIAGVVVFFVLVTVFEYVNGLIFGAPSIEARNDLEALQSFIAQMPIGAWVLLLMGYAAGSFLGGLVMAKIARWNSLVLPLVLGILGTIGWILNTIALPHPLWIKIVGFLCFIPFALIGYRTGK